jgi:transcriptional regulator with XRE-family HTH domain
MRQRRTLRDVSSRARVSLGYLSEVERGQKEASSELLAAICGALDVELSELFWEVSDVLHREEKRALVAKVAALPGSVGAGLATAVPAGTARIVAVPQASTGPQLRAGVAA